MRVKEKNYKNIDPRAVSIDAQKAYLYRDREKEGGHVPPPPPPNIFENYKKCLVPPPPPPQYRVTNRAPPLPNLEVVPRSLINVSRITLLNIGYSVEKKSRNYATPQQDEI